MLSILRRIKPIYLKYGVPYVALGNVVRARMLQDRFSKINTLDLSNASLQLSYSPINLFGGPKYLDFDF